MIYKFVRIVRVEDAEPHIFVRRMDSIGYTSNQDDRWSETYIRDWIDDFGSFINTEWSNFFQMPENHDWAIEISKRFSGEIDWDECSEYNHELYVEDLRRLTSDT